MTSERKEHSSVEALKLAQRALSNRNAPAKTIYEALHAIDKILAQPELTLDGLTPTEFALRELYEFQEATGYDTAAEFKAQRTWVGLTPEEIDSLANLKVDGAYLSVPDTIRQADAKLKEKNTRNGGCL